MQTIGDRNGAIAGAALDLLVPLKDERAADPLAEKMMAPFFKDRAR